MFAPWNLGPTVRITAFTLTALSTGVVAVRFYCRIWVVGRLKVYDFIMLAALLSTWGLCVINHYQLKYGTGGRNPPPGTPMPKMTPEFKAFLDKAFVGSATSWFAYRIMYLVCLGLIKLSILVFYLSFATQPTFRNLVKIWIVVVAVFSIVTIFLSGFECPHDPSITLSAKIFDPRYASKCLNRAILYYCLAAFNMFSDAFILFLPIPSLLQLRMPALKRASLLAVFSAGLLVPIASGIRLWSLYLWANSGSEARYYGGYMLLWSQVEVNTAIVCASAPSLQPLFKRVFGRLVSYRTHSAYYFYGDGAGNTMVETYTEPRRTRPLTPLSDSARDLESPPASYQPNKRSTAGTENELIVVQEVDEEERIRDRVRQFASQSSLGQPQSPRSPARPKEILPYG